MLSAAPFAMILVALAGLFVFGGFIALVAVLVVRVNAATDAQAQPQDDAEA